MKLQNNFKDKIKAFCKKIIRAKFIKIICNKNVIKYFYTIA